MEHPNLSRGTDPSRARQMYFVLALIAVSLAIAIVFVLLVLGKERK
jgi:hypothetical protein